eukprot:1160650-Pelagomonas_calceolata.AAC.14
MEELACAERDRSTDTCLKTKGDGGIGERESEYQSSLKVGDCAQGSKEQTQRVTGSQTTRATKAHIDCTDTHRNYRLTDLIDRTKPKNPQKPHRSDTKTT